MIIVTLTLRGCYVGLGRGLFPELLQLAGIVSISALVCNFYAVIASLIAPWWRFGQAWGAFASFWVTFVAGIVAVRAGLRRLFAAMSWQQAHWLIRGAGLMLGALRGLWWSGLVVLLLLSLGIPAIVRSVEKRSLLGGHFAPLAMTNLERVANWYPGQSGREELIPEVVVPLPKMQKRGLGLDSPNR